CFLFSCGLEGFGLREFGIMVTIRPLGHGDIDGVVRLWDRDLSPTRTATLITCLSELFLDDVGNGYDVPSLVAADSAGNVRAFLGSTSHVMSYGGRQIRLACCGPLMVDSTAHYLAGLVTRAYLNQGQELTITDGATEPAKRIWQKLGGQV